MGGRRGGTDFRSREVPVIGWIEYVSLPEWGIRRIQAKVDTGAETSALHAENIERAGNLVGFDAVCTRTGTRRIRVEAPLARVTRVRSTTGDSAPRFFTKARLVVGPYERTIELGLVDRQRMDFRLLLGRSALAGFLVDPTRRVLLPAK